MKGYTDLEQSKKLLELGIDVNTADMFYRDNGIDAKLMWEHNAQKVKYPCWSLVALLGVLPEDWWGYNKHYFLEISKMGDMSAPYIVSYFRFREQYDGANFDRITHISFQSDNPVDACYEMILKLHELKML